MDGSDVDSSNSGSIFSFSCDSCSTSQPFVMTNEHFDCQACNQTIPRKVAIVNFLIDHFATQFGFPVDSISADTVLREVGDSLGIIEMLLRLEKKFGVSINHEDLEDLETIQDVADYLDQMLAK